MFTHSVLITGLAALVAAQDQRFEANYDDLTPSSVLAAPGFQYKELKYNGLDVITDGIGGRPITGLSAHSNPNVVASNLLDAGSTDLPSIEVTEDVTSFDLQSLWFGCALDTIEDIASEAVTCTLRATGYNAAGTAVAIQEFDFVAGGASAEIVQARFNQDFKGLVKVELSTAPDYREDVASLYDDITYTVHQ